MTTFLAEANKLLERHAAIDIGTNKDETLSRLTGSHSLPTASSEQAASMEGPQSPMYVDGIEDQENKSFDALVIRACIAMESGKEVDRTLYRDLMRLVSEYRRSQAHDDTKSKHAVSSEFGGDACQDEADDAGEAHTAQFTQVSAPEDPSLISPIGETSPTEPVEEISPTNPVIETNTPDQRPMASGAVSGLIRLRQIDLTQTISSPKERARLTADAIFNNSALHQTIEHILTVFDDFRFSHPPGVDLFNVPLERQRKDKPSAIASGRHLFTQYLIKAYFSGQPIKFILPAFPCKSPNAKDKVTGIYPDLGEQLALDRIHTFCESIRNIYPPGAQCVIFSDGRVFADLVGVPPHHVDIYWQTLKQLNRSKWIMFDSVDDHLDELMAELKESSPSLYDSVYKGDDFEPLVKDLTPAACASHLRTLKGRKRGSPDGDSLAAVESKGDGTDTHGERPARESTDPDIACQFVTDHHCQAQAYMYRVWQSQEEVKKLESQILANHKGEAAMLMRGFMKFLITDRVWNKERTVSWIKKQCQHVAKLMIVRNNHLSALVSAKYGDHIRLSIHPHRNAGPKFACRLIDSVPYCVTPWHNTTVKLLDGSHVLLRRSDVERLNVVPKINPTLGSIWCYEQVARETPQDSPHEP